MADKHDVESKGAKPRDHTHARPQYWRHAHRDWRVWIVVLLMVALMFVYVLTDNLSIRPGEREIRPVPAASLP
jgi:hypothetical protein